jgi:hypothetical protein
LPDGDVRFAFRVGCGIFVFDDPGQDLPDAAQQLTGKSTEGMLSGNRFEQCASIFTQELSDLLIPDSRWRTV